MLGEYPLKDYDLLMHVNLGGYINMMQAVLPLSEGDQGFHHLHFLCPRQAPHRLRPGVRHDQGRHAHADA